MITASTFIIVFTTLVFILIILAIATIVVSVIRENRGYVLGFNELGLIVFGIGMIILFIITYIHIFITLHNMQP